MAKNNVEGKGVKQIDILYVTYPYPSECYGIIMNDVLLLFETHISQSSRLHMLYMNMVNMQTVLLALIICIVYHILFQKSTNFVLRSLIHEEGNLISVLLISIY